MSRRRPPTKLISVVASVAAIAVVATLAVVSDGYDAQEVPREESAVWVTRDGQYARVNTQLAQIDTVRNVDDTSAVAQSGATSVVFTRANGRAWPVDPARPLDLLADDDDDEVPGGVSVPTPVGTTTVLSAGPHIAYLTDTGSVYLGRIDAVSATVPINPIADEPESEPDDDGEASEEYRASAIAIAEDGRLAMFSAAEGSIRFYHAESQQFVGAPIPVTDPPLPDVSVDLELALIGERWVLSQPDEGLLWIEGLSDAISTGLSQDARLQRSSIQLVDRVHLADSDRLSSFDVATGERIEHGGGAGIPAAPTEIGGVLYAAWLTPTSGSLWASDTDAVIPLETDEEALEQVVQSLTVEFRSNGQRALLNEASSGMLWTIPDGALIPLSQWTALDDGDDAEAETVQAEDVQEQLPPVAEPDEFGVRAGELVALPVLLNDHDPNQADVLTIVPESIEAGLSDPAFGELSVTSNNQLAVVRVAATSGSATFSYAVSDGSASSEPATVTLTVVPDGQNSAPEWCPSENCTQEWPSPQLAPGGTTTVPVLNGWVDPDGDAFVLDEAVKENSIDPVVVVPLADGRVAIRHLDPNAGEGVIPVNIRVTDVHGATGEMTLNVVITASPRLVVEPIAVVAGVDERLTVRTLDSVSGGSGSFRLVDVVPTGSGSSALSFAVNAGVGEVELTGAEPGDFLMTYTVEDTVTGAEQSATLRFTAVGADAPLSIAPLTAFVRANEDTTVDVLEAVQNSTGRVLMLDGATSLDADLNADVVAQSLLRVSGTTPDGLPGRIGTAIVNITGGAGVGVEGRLTVFLVEPARELGAIAVPDTVAVRAGGQIDIPVTANDVSPRGERLVLHSDVEGSGTEGELAFASGGVLRYLAPETPGRYILRYSVYLENDPSRFDTATVTVTVLPSGANRSPQPPPLTGRVYGGQAVSIPLDSFGADPDGDAVSIVSVTQPRRGEGVASINARGDAVVYRAPSGGVPGDQVSFDYTVRDSGGAIGTAAVRVGILPGLPAQTAPVTYTDTVRLEVGSADTVTVLPLANDRDPALGALQLIDLVPNAPDVDGNTEFARLDALIDSSTSLETGEVRLRVGDVQGTHSYIYTVTSSVSSSTAQGLIVVHVADSAAPDHPSVRDTVVTAKNRGELPRGIDVVSSRAQWASGDLASLELSLVGSAAARYSVDGWRISGEAPEAGELVPFALSGVDASGDEVVTYGFLRILAFENMRIELRQGLPRVSLEEDSSIEFGIAELLDLDSTDDVELRGDAAFAVQRANASCTPTSSRLAAVYDAGREAPWGDACAIEVRLAGQSEWSVLPVLISIVPRDPQAILGNVARTVAPGATDSVDAYEEMTTWEGDRIGNVASLDYRISYSGDAFLVTQSGTSFSFQAVADARPGTRETATVSVSSFGGLSATVNLTVGIAPSDAPRGASFTSQCDVSTGPNCSITVTGLAGEYDPFAGQPGAGLTLQRVGSGGSVSCSVATVTMRDDASITATWPSSPRPTGGECVIPYTVADAQGRTGTGTVTLDLLGYPETPASVSTIGYTGSSVTLTVPLGEAARAYPQLTGVSLYENGTPIGASCVPGSPGSYQCEVTGLVNGERHSYTARAENSVGQSLDTTAHETSAYEAPVVTEFTATPIYVSGTTSASTAVVEIGIRAGADAQSFLLTSERGANLTVPRSGDLTTVRYEQTPGTNTIEVIPVSQFEPPIGAAGSSGAATLVTVTGAGTPSYSGAPSANVTSNTAATVTAPTFSENHGRTSGGTIFLAWRGSTAPVCTVDASGSGVNVDANGANDFVQQSSSGASVSFTGLKQYEDYNFRVCRSNGFGLAVSGTTPVFLGFDPPSPTGSLHYTIKNDPEQQGNVYRYVLDILPSVDSPPDGFQTVYLVNGVEHGSFTSSTLTDGSPASVEIRVLYRHQTYPSFQTESPPAITPQTGSAPVPVTVTYTSPSVTGDSCIPHDQPTDNSGIAVTANAASAATRDATETVVDGVRQSVSYRLSWNAGTPFAALDSIEFETVPICEPPAPDPDPDEDEGEGEEEGEGEGDEDDAGGDE